MSNNRWVFLVIAILLAVAGFASGVDASTVHPKAGGGGDNPTPFKGTNQKVELADGERYSLVGTVIFWHGNPYFEVDLDNHPWLANAKRTASPYYPVEGSALYLRKFENVRLRWIFEAHGAVRQVSDAFEYDIVLAPLSEPTSFNLSGKRSGK